MTRSGREAACLVTFIFIVAGALGSAMRLPPSAGAADDAPPNTPADPDDPKFAGRFHGQVMDADGKPLRRARVFVVPLDRQFNTLPTAIADAGRVRAETDEEGRFEFEAPDLTHLDLDGLAARRDGLISATADGYGPDWIFFEGRARSALRAPADRIKQNEFVLRLAKDDVPIHGRILDANGRPLAGAHVRFTGLMIPRERDLDAHLAREATLPLDASPDEGERSFYYRPHQIRELVAETSTDADGRFTMSGFGRDRLVSLEVSKPGVVDTSLTVMTRDAPNVGVRPNFNGLTTAVIYGTGLTLLLDPGWTISGVVRDADSQEPIAGIWVGIGSENFLPSRTKDENYPRDGVLSHRTTTDADGRFRITGLHLLPAKRTVTAASAPGMPYQSAAVFVQGDGPVMIECRRGIPFRLKLVDEQGRPVEAEVTYLDVAPNPHAPTGFCYPCRTPLSRTSRNVDGTYQGFVVPGPGAILVETPGRAGYRPACVDPKAFFAPKRTVWTAQERITAYGTQGTLSTSCGLHFQDDYAAIVLVDPAPNSASLELAATVMKDRPRRGRLIDADGNPVMGVKTQGMTLYQYDYEPPLRAAAFRLTGLHPDRVRRITFIQEERQLIAFLPARGDGDTPYTVRMEPWATVAGRIVDENGKAIPIGKPGSDWEIPPTLWMSDIGVANADPSAGEYASVKIEANGQFRVERLVPGQRYRAEIHRGLWGRHFAGMAFTNLVLRPGEVRDLGDVRVKASSQVVTRLIWAATSAPRRQG